MLRPSQEPKEPMMGVTKVTGKGQVSIPFEMRERLRLTEGTRLVAVATQDAVILQRADAVLGGTGPRGVIDKVRSLARRFFWKG